MGGKAVVMVPGSQRVQSRPAESRSHGRSDKDTARSETDPVADSTYTDPKAGFPRINRAACRTTLPSPTLVNPSGDGLARTQVRAGGRIAFAIRCRATR